jgi:hypothetical protein
MAYLGVWDAAANNPALANGTGSPGDVYRVGTAGTQFGITFDVGDYAIYNGTVWEKSDTTDAVASVNGKTGVVTLTKADVGLGSVDNTADAAKNVLSATKLTPGRKINGVLFDGTADITVADGTKEPALPAGTTSQFLRGDKTWQPIPATYTLPPASATVLGGVKQGDGVTIAADGTLSATVDPDALAGYQLKSEKGVNNGYASLDASGRIPSSQLSVSALEYKGTWDAAANDPPLVEGVGTPGDMWRVTTTGTQFGVTFTAGDFALFNGTRWETATSGTAGVSSVAGLTGDVAAAPLKTSLALDKVDNTADAAKNVLSASKLTTARTLNGVPFDGTANITVPVDPATDALYEKVANRGVASGYTPLDASGLVPAVHLPPAVDTSGFEETAAKGQPLGYAPLDDRSLIPVEFLPADIGGAEMMAELTDVTPVGLKVGTAVDEVAARRAIGVPLTADETAAGITAVDTQFPVGHVYRYVTNTEPGTTDVTAGWQKFLSLGGLVELDAQVDDVFRMTGQLVIKAKTTLRMGPQTVILRDWVGNTDKYVNAQFRNAQAPVNPIANPGPWVPTVTDDDIVIQGGRIRPVDSTKTGCGYYFMGTKNLTMINPTVERTHKEWAFAIGGSAFSLTGVRVEDNQEVLEDGIHILYGGGVVKADRIVSGDDCFAVGSSWNLPIDGVDIHMGSFESRRGYAIRLIQNREGITAAYPAPTSQIKNVRFHSGQGRAGLYRNGLIHSAITAPGLVSDITVDGVTLDAGTETHDGVSPFGCYFQYVSRLKLINVVARNARRDVFALDNCPQAEVIGCTGFDSQGAASFYSLLIKDSADVKVSGGQYTRSLTFAIRVVGSSTVALNGTTVKDIPSNFAGLVVENASTVSVSGMSFRKASGATTTSGIRTASATCNVTADACQFEVDRPFLSTGANYVKIRNAKHTETITSVGNVNTWGDDELGVLCMGGVSDDLATIGNGYKGQELTLFNAEANPAVAKVTIRSNSNAFWSTGNILGPDVVLDSVDAFVRYRFDGTNWRQVLTNTLTGPAFVHSGTAGVSPSLSASSVDAVANLNLIPKGTGVVQTKGVEVEVKGHKHVAADVTGARSWAAVPDSSTAAGTAGQEAYDATWRYVCVTTGAAGAALWKRTGYDIVPW